MTKIDLIWPVTRFNSSKVDVSERNPEYNITWEKMTQDGKLTILNWVTSDCALYWKHVYLSQFKRRYLVSFNLWTLLPSSHKLSTLEGSAEYFSVPLWFHSLFFLFEVNVWFCCKIWFLVMCKWPFKNRILSYFFFQRCIVISKYLVLTMLRRFKLC